ncbi:MAG: universal stress protein, partial [Anaerolineae bacterium]|nr:universal stress protein [Anaerolineae bacterium]
EEAGERVPQAARAAWAGPSPDLRLRRGSPVRAILAEAEEGAYDLVALGGGRGPDLPAFLAGPVALAVARRASQSVLLAATGWARLDRILICTGGTTISWGAVEAGAWLAAATGAEATILHVAGPVPSMYTGLPELEETLQELLQEETPLARHLREGAALLARLGVEGSLALRHGAPAVEILQEAERGDYDLLVLGASETAGRLREWLLGSVTWDVAEGTARPVLVVRPFGAFAHPPLPAAG